MAEPDPQQPADAAPDCRGFNTTRWSLVARVAASSDHDARAALDELCRIYWRPVYAEIRRRGISPHDAQDLTQDFFTRLLRHNTFGRAEREKGRLRSYLLAALDHFMADQRRRDRATKRGAGLIVTAVNFADGEQWLAHHAESAMTPAEAFDHGWAVILMDRALDTLRKEYLDGGRGGVFNAALPFLTAEDAGGYDEACAPAALSPEAFRVAVHRLRKRFRLRIRQQVEMTVSEPQDTDAEMKHLFGI